MLTSFFLGTGEHLSRLSSRVRKFYKKQDEFIDSLEKMYNEDSSGAAPSSQRFIREKKRTEWLIRATVILNCVSDTFDHPRRLHVHLGCLQTDSTRL